MIFFNVKCNYLKPPPPPKKKNPTPCIFFQLSVKNFYIAIAFANSNLEIWPKKILFDMKKIRENIETGLTGD